jgi:hypothetical protein
MDFSKLTWTCHICGKEQPDDKISVYSSEIDMGSGIMMTQNVRYCNDNEDCTKKAKTFSHFEKRNDE